MSNITLASRRLILAGLAATGLSPSAAMTQTRDRRRLVLGAFSRTIGNTAYEIARSRGWFREHPALADFEFDFIEFETRPAIQAAFEQQALDVLFSADAPSLMIRAAGADVSIGGPLTLARQEVLVRHEAMIGTLADLEGARVGVQARTSSHQVFLRMLRRAGIDPRALRLVHLDNPQGQAAFEAGQLDAWITWSPWVEPQEVSGRGSVIARAETGMYNIATFARRFSHDRPDAAHAVMEVVTHGTEWIRENSGQARSFAAGFLNMEPALVHRVWNKIEWGPSNMAVFADDLVDKALFFGRS